jgi:hypothetical protein
MMAEVEDLIIDNTQPIKRITEQEDLIIDYNNLDYNFDGKNFKASIDSIILESGSDHLKKKENEWKKKRYTRGEFLKIKYSLTNPYNYDVMTPIPKYFEIGSMNKNFSRSTTKKHGKNYYIDNGTKITTKEGVSLIMAKDEMCGTSKQYCINFKPNQKKEFYINFDDAIETYGSLYLFAFDITWDDYKYRRPQPVGFEISMTRAEIIGTKNF